jgi:hypothetical protein
VALKKGKKIFIWILILVALALFLFWGNFWDIPMKPKLEWLWAR